MKYFNDTGTCVPHKHYMVDISAKMKKVKEYIVKGLYFAINRPRQYGKTTTLATISRLYADSEYFIIRLSFEGIGDDIFKEESRFCKQFIKNLSNNILESFPQSAEFLKENLDNVDVFDDLSLVLKTLNKNCTKKLVLVIDEVDKSSNNQLFINFIAMLRDKYLKRDDGNDFTFHSVILAGVHDVKTLKIHIRKDEEAKLNSPWNIAADFDVDMTFNAQEISTMLIDYSQDKKIEMDIPAISERIYYYTAGYPYLVSKMCKVVDEKILQSTQKNEWTIENIDTAFKMLTAPDYTTTLFDDIGKNLENNKKLYDLIFDVVISGVPKAFILENTSVNLALTFGLIANDNGVCKLHNLIFEQRLYRYLLSKNHNKEVMPSVLQDYITFTAINMKYTLQRFQQFMKEHYSNKHSNFLEHNGRLLFLSFLRPIINGRGFEFKESTIGDDRRTDLVITYNQNKYVIELKLWRGEEYHQRGLQQLSDYLDLYNLKQGFLLIYDFRKEKEYKEQTIQFADKEIFAVWV